MRNIDSGAYSFKVVSHNLIVISDLHMGSDLVHHAQPEAPCRAAWAQQRDASLVALFDFYRANEQGGRPWRLVIAGDFMDFAGMSVMTHAGLETTPNAEELVHGLGSAPDHTLAKLRLVMQHEAAVMKSLANFVAAGNSLVIVRGNHDVEWHWEAVQHEFRRMLAEHAAVLPEQIEFAPWFYYEEGVVFIEHGHQYDTFCSFDNLLHPVSPADPRRTIRSLSDVLLRYVVRPTRGMTEAGHAASSAVDYVRFAARLGARGTFTLLQRFAGAIAALLALWHEHVSFAAQRIRAEHEHRMAALSRIQRVQLERLRSLAKLQRPPVTRSLLALLSCLMLDRLMLGTLGALMLAVLWLFVDSWELGLFCAAPLALLLSGTDLLWRRMRESLEPSAELRARSSFVAGLFPAAFVVMGHTHLPETVPVAERATYVNLGAWAEEEPEAGREPSLPATRTHLVLTHVGDEALGQLLTWGDAGPQPFLKA